MTSLLLRLFPSSLSCIFCIYATFPSLLSPGFLPYASFIPACCCLSTRASGRRASPWIPSPPSTLPWFALTHALSHLYSRLQPRWERSLHARAEGRRAASKHLPPALGNDDVVFMSRAWPRLSRGVTVLVSASVKGWQRKGTGQLP